MQGPGVGGGRGHSSVASCGPPRVCVSHLLAVLRVGEVDEVVIVHLLGVDDVAVLFLAQVFGVDAVGPQEFLVGHTEGLANGLCDQLGLWAGRSPLATGTGPQAPCSQERRGCDRAGCRGTCKPGVGPCLGLKQPERNCKPSSGDGCPPTNTPRSATSGGASLLS